MSILALAVICFVDTPLLSVSLPQQTVVEINSNSNSSSSSCNESSLQLKSMLLANADRKIAERRAWLASTHTEGSQTENHFGLLTGAPMWYMFTPPLPCMWTFEKIPSVSLLHDGGKWLCGLHEVHSSRAKIGVHYDAVSTSLQV